MTSFFFGSSTIIPITPLINWLYNEMPSFLPEWTKWGLILILGVSTIALFYPLIQKVSKWWNE
jgi:hypothetical protein